MTQPVDLVVIPRDQLAELIRQEVSASLHSLQSFVKPKEQPDLMNVDQMAELLHVAKQTVYGKVHYGEFPPGVVFKRGKKLYFSRKATEAWIKAGAK